MATVGVKGLKRSYYSENLQMLVWCSLYMIVRWVNCSMWLVGSDLKMRPHYCVEHRMLLATANQRPASSLTVRRVR